MEKPSPFPSEIGDAIRKSSESVPTLRFTLSLSKSDEKTCPEFSFLDLVKSSARKVGCTFDFMQFLASIQRTSYFLVDLKLHSFCVRLHQTVQMMLIPKNCYLAFLNIRAVE